MQEIRQIWRMGAYMKFQIRSDLPDPPDPPDPRSKKCQQNLVSNSL